MRGWLISLAAWCRLPVRGGIAELDIQVAKMRALRDSYRTSSQEQRHGETPEVEKAGERLCMQ